MEQMCSIGALALRHGETSQSVEPMATLTPEPRTAQREIVGMLSLKGDMWFQPNGEFCISRDQQASAERGAGIPGVSKYFDTLEIPYVVRVERQTVGSGTCRDSRWRCVGTILPRSHASTTFGQRSRRLNGRRAVTLAAWP